MRRSSAPAPTSPAILQVRYGVNAWAGLVIGIAAGALVGAVIGALSFRSGLRGSYFALVTLAFAEVLRIIASVAPITGAGVGTLVKLDLRWEAFQFQSRAPFYWIILGFVAVSLLIVQRLEAQPLRRLPRGGARERGRREGRRHRRVPRQARRDDALGRDHGRGRLLLRAVFPVPRCRHRLRPVDLGRGAARADHRRHRHGVRPAARRAGGARRSARSPST